MIAIAPARNIPQIGGERHPAQKEEGSGMSDLQTRLEVFSEFLDCAGVALWHYDGEMRLLRSNHPCKEDLQQLFGAAESKTRILDYCRQNRLPCLGPDSAALLWMAAPYKVNGVLTDIYVIGPVFPSAISEQALTAALGKVHMPPELTNQVRELLKTVPSVQYSLLVQYGVMLYRCLYEEKIDPSDIQWLAPPLEPRAPRTGEENVNTRRGTYAFEQEFFRIVEEGNVNAERPQSSIQIQPGFLSRTDPLRHAKNMAIAELTLICRAAIRGGLPEDTAYGLADFYIQNSEDCRNTAQVYQLATNAFKDFTARVHRHKSRGYSKEINDCIGYLELHLGEKLNMSALAESVGYNKNYLSTKFSREVGVSLSDYLARLRVERAKLALRNTSESIQQISERLGFGSVSYFSAQFRKAVGQTPSDYRNRRGGAAAPPETLQSGS